MGVDTEGVTSSTSFMANLTRRLNEEIWNAKKKAIKSARTAWIEDKNKQVDKERSFRQKNMEKHPKVIKIREGHSKNQFFKVPKASEVSSIKAKRNKRNKYKKVIKRGIKNVKTLLHHVKKKRKRVTVNKRKTRKPW